MILQHRVLILHADPLPFFISSTLIFGGKAFESRSVRFWSGCLFANTGIIITISIIIIIIIIISRSSSSSSSSNSSSSSSSSNTDNNNNQ